VYEELADIGADSAEVRPTLTLAPTPTLTLTPTPTLTLILPPYISQARAGAILSGLQFLEEQKSWPTSAFSGEGEGARRGGGLGEAEGSGRARVRVRVRFSSSRRRP